MGFAPGPYPSQDHCCGVMIARPIPPGATVIAKPIIPGVVGVPNKSYVPLQVPDQIMPPHIKNSFAPRVMVWNAVHPEGQMMPLRQPQPIVYFNPC